jgi:hypothetical protein
MVDWEKLGRIETITAQTPTGTVLDPARRFSSFTNGVYAVYQVCGSVDFVATSVSINAVVSGVFFGPPPSTKAAAP